MSETLMALMKKGSSGGGGGSDFIGQNQYLVASGDVKSSAAIGNDIFNYQVNADIEGTFGSHDQILIVNVEGHTSAEVTTASRYDGLFGFANGIVTTLVNASSQSGAVTALSIDITDYDYLILVSAGYSGRKIVITN